MRTPPSSPPKPEMEEENRDYSAGRGKTLIKELQAAGLQASCAEQERFNTYFSRVSGPPVKGLAKEFVEWLCGFRAAAVGEAKGEAGNPKSLLSAFLCLTKDFLDPEQNEEQQLAVLAKGTSDAFDRLSEAGEGEVSAAAEEFHLAWTGFNDTFNAWQSGGTATMLRQALSTYTDLKAAHLQLPPEEVNHSTTDPTAVHTEAVRLAITHRMKQVLDFIYSVRTETLGLPMQQQNISATLLDEVDEVLKDRTSSPRNQNTDSPTVPPQRASPPAAAGLTPLSLPTSTPSAAPSSAPLSPQSASRQSELERKRQMAMLAHQSRCNVRPDGKDQPGNNQMPGTAPSAQPTSASFPQPSPRSPFDRSPSLGSGFFSSLAQNNSVAGSGGRGPAVVSHQSPVTADVLDPFSGGAPSVSAPPPAAGGQPPRTGGMSLKDLQEMIKTQATRAFWDVVTADLSNPEGPRMERLQAVIGEVQEGFLTLCGRSKDLSAEVKAALDWDERIKDQLCGSQATGQGKRLFLRLLPIFDFIGEMIVKLDSPYNEAITKHKFRAFTQNLTLSAEAEGPADELAGSVVRMFKWTQQKLEAVEEEVSKYRMQLLVPHLKQRAEDIECQWIEAETDHPASVFGTGPREFERARLSLHSVLVNMTTTLKVDPTKSDGSKVVTVFRQQVAAFLKKKLTQTRAEGEPPLSQSEVQFLIMEQVLNIIHTHTAVRTQDIPEDYIMDTHNLCYLQQVIQCTVLMACFVHILQLLLKQYLGSAVTQMADNEVMHFRTGVAEAFRDPNITLEKLKDAVVKGAEELIEGRYRQSASQAHTTDPRVTKPREWEEFLKLLGTMVKKTADTQDGVYTLYHNRLFACLTAGLYSFPLNGPHGPEVAQAASEAPDSITTTGEPTLQGLTAPGSDQLRLSPLFASEQAFYNVSQATPGQANANPASSLWSPGPFQLAEIQFLVRRVSLIVRYHSSVWQPTYSSRILPKVASGLAHIQGPLSPRAPTSPLTTQTSDDQIPDEL